MALAEAGEKGLIFVCKLKHNEQIDKISILQKIKC